MNTNNYASWRNFDSPLLLFDPLLMKAATDPFRSLASASHQAVVASMLPLRKLSLYVETVDKQPFDKP